MTAFHIVFWLSVIGLLYIYAGYPLLVAMFAGVFGRPPRRAPFEGRFSVVISAHNEANNLPRKIQSILRSDAAAQIDEIIVGSDGSTDETAAVVRALNEPRVKLIEFPERRGKASVLDDAVPRCSSEIVVMTDARQELDPGAFTKLLSNFADETVGVASGELVFRRSASDTAAARGIDAYWSYEKWIRKRESRLASVPGATGALFAIRKNLFVPIPPRTLLDDVAIPMQVVVRGFRCVFEEGAAVYDEPAQSAAQEAVRKRRTIAGNVQLIGLYPSWLLPWRNPVWWQLISHKLGRLLSPFFLVGAAASNAALVGQPSYRLLGVVQAAIYAVAAAGWLLRGTRGKIGLIGIPFMFISLNVTTLLGIWDAVAGHTSATWRRWENETE